MGPIPGIPWIIKVLIGLGRRPPSPTATRDGRPSRRSSRADEIQMKSLCVGPKSKKDIKRSAPMYPVGGKAAHSHAPRGTELKPQVLCDLIRRIENSERQPSQTYISFQGHILLYFCKSSAASNYRRETAWTALRGQRNVFNQCWHEPWHPCQPFDPRAVPGSIRRWSPATWAPHSRRDWIWAAVVQLKAVANCDKFIPGHPWDEKGLQRQIGVGVLVCIPGMKSASRPADEPLTNRG